MTKNIRKVSNIRYASIREMDISNGEGVGVALFVQGCPFHCYNCFNPETWYFDGGKEWTPEIKDKFLELINRPYIKRVSILGGEPLADENLDDIFDLISEIKRRFSDTKTIWLYTGYTLKLSKLNYINPTDNYKTKQDYNFYTTESSKNIVSNFLRSEVIEKVDTVVDGRYIDSQRDISLKWRGSSNQRVISVQESLKQGKVITLV